MRIISNGNVGIGTQAPSVLFEVNGATKTSTLTATSDISSSTRIWAANATIASNLVISGDISASLFSYLKTGYGEFNQFVTIAGSLQATGNTSLLGSVGVNKSSSGSFSLDVSGNANITGTTNLTSNLTVGGTAVITGATTISNTANVTSNLTVGGTVRSINGSASAPTYSFTNDAATGMYLPSASNLAFSTVETERMRILSNGYVGIGRSNPQFLLDVNGELRCTSFYPSVIYNPNGSSSGPSYTFSNDIGTGMFRPSASNLAWSTNGTERMRIDATGQVMIGRTSASYPLDITGTARATDFIATSDRRVKTDIQTISNALDIVNGLRGVYFTRTGETHRQVGVIAQEVEEVLPEVVHTSVDDLKSVSYGNMVGVLIEALKDVSKRLEKMENKE